MPPQNMNGIELSDYAESISTTAVLTLGVSEYGTISNATDEDWFGVSLVAGQTYEFRLLGVGSTFLSDTYLRLRDAAGNQLAFDDDGFTSFSNTHELDSRLIYTATTTGTYYIEADAFSTGTGNYLLTGVEQDPSTSMVFTVDEIAWQLTNNGVAYFGEPQASAFNVGADGQLTVNITNLTAAGQALARAALVTWSDLTGIQFVETSGAAEISFDDSDAGTTAYANTSITGTTITSASVMVSTGWLDTFGTTFNSYSYETYIHEIGHALGLGHGGNYNGFATFGTNNYYLNDSLAYSIMSYMPAIGDEFGAPNTFVNADFRFMLTPVLADFVAIDRLYGSSTNTRTGNTTYGFNSNTGNAQLDAAVGFGSDVNFMVHDNGGTDTLDFSLSSANQTLNLNADTLSSVLGGVFNLSISRETLIENALGGSGNDRLIGNAAANRLEGGLGNDTLLGGAGNDLYVIRDAAAQITETSGNGTADRVVASVSFVLGAGDDIEILGTTSAVGTASINLIGNELAQTILGNAGANRLEDGGGAGVDTLVGGAGNDLYVIRNAGAQITETSGNGTADRVVASVSYMLGAGDSIEILGTTSAVGTASINLIGNELAQTILGNAGANRLEDGGGAGIDTLVGGAGNDLYVIRNSGAQITETSGNGTADRVVASVSFILGAGDSIEILGTTSAVGTASINLTGNELAQTVLGNAGANRLNGREGADTMTGGDGADRFIFNTALGASNLDRITDYNVAADTFELENAIFTGLGTGVLTAAAFRSNLTGLAQDASDRVIYDSDDGSLWFDADGTGAGARVRFAVLDTGLAMTSADFFVV